MKLILTDDDGTVIDSYSLDRNEPLDEQDPGVFEAVAREAAPVTAEDSRGARRLRPAGGGRVGRVMTVLKTDLCDACGDGFAIERKMPSPIGPEVKVVMCDECFAFWSSDEGQASILRDLVEAAERKAGWDPTP